MGHVKQRIRTAYPVDIPFSAEESSRFRFFLKETGRKAGPWFRALAIRAMDEADGAAASCGEARELAAFIASMSPEQLRQIKFAKAEAQAPEEASA